MPASSAKKAKRKEQAKETRNGSRLASSRIRIDNIVNDVLSQGKAVEDGRSVFALSQDEAETETRGQMLQRHKAERRAMRAHLDTIYEERRTLKKTLDNADERKELSRQMRLLSVQLRTAHEQEVEAMRKRTSSSDDEAASSKDSSAPALLSQPKKDGPLRVLSTVHTPGPQYAKNTKPPAK